MSTSAWQRNSGKSWKTAEIEGWPPVPGTVRVQGEANPDLSSGLMAGAEGRLAPFAVTILASGYDNGPAAGPVAGVPQAPGVLLPGSQGRFALVRVLAGARRCVATRP